MALILGLTGNSYAQLTPVCCNNSSNNITNLFGSTFAATNAQAYYWEICTGNATISGSNTNQNVEVNASGGYTLKVTRFVNGNCMESCKVITGTIGPGGGGSTTCPTSSNVAFSNEGAGGLCTTGLAYLNGVSNVNYVNWTWALGPHTGSVNNAGTVTPIYYPSGNWNNYYIVLCADVYFNDGTVCTQVCKSFLLDCGKPGIGGASRTASPYPNPTEDIFQIKNDSEKELSSVLITDAMGSPVKSLKSNLDQEIDLSAEKEGIYLLRMEYTDGTSETKVLSIER